MYCTRCIVKDVLYIFILLFVHTSSELAMTSDLLSEGSHIHMFSVIFVISMILMNVDNLHIETLTDSETCSLQVILRFEKHSLTARRRFLKTFQCFYGRKLVYSNLGFYKTSVCVCVCACASVCVCVYVHPPWRLHLSGTSGTAREQINDVVLKTLDSSAGFLQLYFGMQNLIFQLAVLSCSYTRSGHSHDLTCIRLAFRT